MAVLSTEGTMRMAILDNAQDLLSQQVQANNVVEPGDRRN